MKQIITVDRRKVKRRKATDRRATIDRRKNPVTLSPPFTVQLAAPPSPNRTGIIHRVDYSTFTSDQTQAQLRTWPVDGAARIDGVGLKNLGESQYQNDEPALVYNLEHLAITSQNAILPGVRSARVTIYPKAFRTSAGDPVLYDIAGFQSLDKPRSDLNMFGVARDLGLAFRQMNWTGQAIFMPGNYQEETENGWREILYQNHSDPEADRNFSLDILGKSGGGSQWAVHINKQAYTAPSAAAGAVDLDVPGTPFVFDVVPAHLGKWHCFVYQHRFENRTPAQGATVAPVFRCWYTRWNHLTQTVEEHRLVGEYLQPYGMDAGHFNGWAPALNDYKGSFHGATNGPYTGGKTQPIVYQHALYHLGDASSDYSSVHPLRLAQP